MAQVAFTARERSRGAQVTNIIRMIVKLRYWVGRVTLEFRFGVRASLRRN
jgi:hypothetical protein